MSYAHALACPGFAAEQQRFQLQDGLSLAGTLLRTDQKHLGRLCAFIRLTRALVDDPDKVNKRVWRRQLDGYPPQVVDLERVQRPPGATRGTQAHALPQAVVAALMAVREPAMGARGGGDDGAGTSTGTVPPPVPAAPRPRKRKGPQPPAPALNAAVYTTDAMTQEAKAYAAANPGKRTWTTSETQHLQRFVDAVLTAVHAEYQNDKSVGAPKFPTTGQYVQYYVLAPRPMDDDGVTPRPPFLKTQITAALQNLRLGKDGPGRGTKVKRLNSVDGARQRLKELGLAIVDAVPVPAAVGQPAV